ncbi:hypothetical protein [Streptomyces sp. bgisy027]|uniref:hypothetical protein n=1 Tax=Streptomyces sp. bgisy027 TaxID=3413770 RepID=UPI003D72C2CD
MSETTKRDPLANIEAFEAGAFRVAHVARQLLADHPDLPIREIRPQSSAYQDPGRTYASLEISAGSTAGVRAWADALRATVKVTFYDHNSTAAAFESHQAQAVVSGVDVAVVATRGHLNEDELAAWRAQQSAAAGGGEGR